MARWEITMFSLKEYAVRKVGHLWMRSIYDIKVSCLVMKKKLQAGPSLRTATVVLPLFQENLTSKMNDWVNLSTYRSDASIAAVLEQ